jgi:hypothetical protein
MAVSTKMAVFWIVAPCSLVEVYQRFTCNFSFCLYTCSLRGCCVMVWGENINFVIFIGLVVLGLFYANTVSFCVWSTSKGFNCRFKCPVVRSATPPFQLFCLFLITYVFLIFVHLRWKFLSGNVGSLYCKQQRTFSNYFCYIQCQHKE